MKTITSRFVMLVATAAVLPLMIYGVVSVGSLLRGTRQSVITGNMNVASRAAEQVQLYIESTARILHAIAADLEGTRLETWQQERILKNYVLAFPEFREITLFDAIGVPLVSSRVGAARIGLPSEAVQDGAGLYLAAFSLDDDLLPTTTAAVRVTQPGRAPAWLVGEFNLLEMWRMVDRIRVGQRGFALIVAPDGRLIAHGDPNGKRRIARGENMKDHPLVRASYPTSAPRAQEFLSPAGERVLAVAAPIAPLGWILAVEQPTSEAYESAQQLVRQLFVAITLALVATVSAGFLWGRSFIRPIFALTRGTRAIADGRLDERVSITSGGLELQELGAAFNGMADRLVELQEDVRKQERQAVFGRIAVGLVHDLSHPIQNVANNCKLILKMSDDPDYRQTFRRTVDREFAAIRRVLEGLRNLARPMPLERFPVDVNRSVADVVEAMQSYGEFAGVRIGAQLSSETPYIEGDLFALGRVYRNLIFNALQATAPGGVVTISTELAGPRVFIRVTDTGCGIPADRLVAIFEDFATTKRRGLGLGLAICKKIVDQMNGAISVTSEVGKGSTFVLEFGAVPPATRG